MPSSDRRRSARPRRPRGSLRGSPLFRLRFGFVAIAMVLSVFGVRLVQLQGIDPKAYAEMAAAEGMEEVSLPAERGDILDRNGEPLARSVEGRDGASPTRCSPPTRRRRWPSSSPTGSTSTTSRSCRGCARRGAGSSTSPGGSPPRSPRRSLDEAAELGFEGLDTRRDPVRDYPAEDVAANLVGFMGTDDPLAGFERTFDALLAGTDGSARYQVGGGNKIPLGESTVVEPVDGQDLHTTLDMDLQWYAQRVLRQTVEDASADSGFAVVMDTQTGEVLTLADHPTFDASDPLVADKEDLGSRAMSDVYEPGSVEKVLTVAGLLDAGKVTPRTRLRVGPELRRDGRVINDWFPHGDIRLTLAGVIAKSSNIGTVRAADEFDRGELRRYLTRFGLGDATDIGVRGESPGILPSNAIWNRLIGDRVAFGQSLSVNAVQMAAAVNTIANGGVRVDPSLITGQRHHRRRHRRRHRRGRHPSGHQRAGRPADDADDGAGHRPRGGHRARRGGPGLPGGRQDRHRPAGRRRVRLLRRHLHRLVRRVRARGRPALHDLRRGPEPAQRRRWRLGRRPGVLQDHELRPAPLRGPADRHQAVQPPARVVIEARPPAGDSLATW